MAASRPEAREHLVCGYRKVSVRRRLKPPISIAKFVYVYIYVQESQRFWDFVRIYTCESQKGFMSVFSAFHFVPLRG